jgi:hypothetical protein
MPLINNLVLPSPLFAFAKVKPFPSNNLNIAGDLSKISEAYQAIIYASSSVLLFSCRTVAALLPIPLVPERWKGGCEAPIRKIPRVVHGSISPGRAPERDASPNPSLVKLRLGKYDPA